MKSAILSVLLFVTVLYSTSAAAKHDHAPSGKAMKTFILVHGAWMAPFAWDNVTKGLKKSGAHVIVIELPGHGSDTTNPASLSLDVYKNKVIEAVNSIDGKVILVGHSLAGMIISAVVEEVPDKIEKLIYIGAFVPADGQTLLALASTDAQAHLGPSMVPSADKLTLDVKRENVVDIFCADSSPEIQTLILKKFRPEPAIPFKVATLHFCRCPAS